MWINLSWDHFCFNVALLQEQALHPRQGLHKVPGCYQSPVSHPCWHRKFLLICMYIYIWPPSRGSEQWPWHCRGLSRTAVILFSPTQLNSGVWPGSTWCCQLSIHWQMRGPLRGANHGCRMFFWFPLLSLYVFSSQITLLKWVCLSFVGPCDSVELAGCKTEPCYSSKKI